MIRDREPALLLLGTPEQFGADLRGRRAARDDRHPDVVPERGRRGGLRRTRRPDRRSSSSSAARRWRTPWPTWPPRWAGTPRSSTAATSPATTLDARSVVVVATQGHGDEEALERAVSAPAGVHRPGRLAQARRGRARRTSPTAACPATCSTGCACPSAWTSATPPTARSRSRSWPSWCSCGPPARSDRPPRGERPGRAAAARRDRHGDRPGVRDDRDRRRRQPPARARRDDVLVLLRGLPRPVRGRSRAVPVHRLAGQEA